MPTQIHRAVVNYMTELIGIIKSTLTNEEAAKACEGLRLSVFGWSKYAVENGVLILHYHYGDEEHDDEVSSIDELRIFDRENMGDFEYSQAISADMIAALRKLV